ncbi:MAG: hypothetical protein JNK85_09965 [Verrucomicrobiales bacterium]|nr:hypothetical protein [Verrucomicrobiales bacterium]
MKSPRSLLLGRHQGAEAKLDLIRARTLASLKGSTGSIKAAPISAPLWRVLWIELFYRPRHAWAGIGACGLLALGINGLAIFSSDLPPTASSSPLVAVEEAVRQRSQLLAELRGQTPPLSPHPAPITAPDRNRRRSAIRAESGLGIA